MAQAEKRPVVVVVDDDAQVLSALVGDLRKRYGKSYRLLSTTDVAEAERHLKTLEERDEAVALVVSDQRMPELDGVSFLRDARRFFPDAKRVLLTAYADTEAAIRAINEAQLDQYLVKPWDPPEERLYPALDGLLEDWRRRWRPGYGGLRIVGFQWSPHSHDLKDFLSANLVPYRWLEFPSDPEAQELVARRQLDPARLPAVIFEDGQLALSPTVSEVAERIALKARPQQTVYDLAIVGAGPAGLAAAVYGASEGLKTVLIDRRAPGGQAGTSSRIENYLGFPTGITGQDLAQRAITQARRFGTEFIVPQTIEQLALQERFKVLKLEGGSNVTARALIVATGMDYRKLEAQGVERFTGAGVYYGAANTEAMACVQQQVVVVGGGNSAGQAAMYLSRFARRVLLVVRREGLSATMSQYLIDQLGRQANVELVPFSVVTQVQGEQQVRGVLLEDVRTQQARQVEAAAVYVFIGTRPAAQWLPDDVLRDDKGFVITGRELKPRAELATRWRLKREPMSLETSVPGVFAVGDVRSGAMNRVASAVGEGAMAVKLTHEYLEES